MPEMKHTPGPWSRDKYGNLIDANGRNVLFRSVSILCAGDGVAEAEKNTDLIAAAPDLLAALIGLDEAFCSINEFSTKEERHDARLKLIAARAAIAKATGQVPA